MDLYLFRGYFLDLTSYPLSNKVIESEVVKSDDLELKIFKKDDFYNIKFKNKSLKYFYATTYRWDINFPMNDSIFSLHYRTKTYYPKYENNYNNSFDCGTGIGYFSINPFENFSTKISYKKLIENYLEGNHFVNTKNDTIFDLIYNKPLIVKNRNKEFEIFKRDDIIKKDSVAFRLYIPIYSYNFQKLIYVKSNPFNVAYLDVVKNLTLIEENNHKDFRNF